ncbi:MAG TPA: nucleotidyl transferase AbiEii/AbiGii toxin family protein [bacterium]|nr:nucleotidyl transferase AbiEii/AbiGii toxin family protein [bacterium]HOM27075.1 nucleotidyl transferase AbiEii/AbiGii toxin family protein [bacterium]
MKEQLEKSLLNPIHTEILSKEQKEILKELKFTKKMNFYLADGTGLALYLGHRTSIDFDFYSQQQFKTLSVYFKNGEIVNDTEDTFEIIVKNTHLSFFYYPYKLIRKPVEMENILVASIEDISAMKIISIVQRGNYRDFIDIYFLMKIFGIKKLINWLKEKYLNYSTFLILKGLIYFEDADKTVKEDKERIRMIEKIEWKQVKKFIKKEVEKFVKNYSI